MSVRRYRKKPVVIEAVQWDGTQEGASPIIDWILAGDGTARWHEETTIEVDPECDPLVVEPGHFGRLYDDGEPYWITPTHIAIDTSDCGTTRAEVDHWVIRTADGQFDTVAPEDFAATYEPAVPAEGVAP